MLAPARADGLMVDGRRKLAGLGSAAGCLLPVLPSLGFMGCGGLAAAPALPCPPPPPASIRLYSDCLGCCRDELTARYKWYQCAVTMVMSVPPGAARAAPH